MKSEDRASAMAGKDAGTAPSRPPARRRLSRAIGHVSTRLSEATLAGFLALALLLPVPQPPRAATEAAPSPGPAGPISVRRVTSQPVAVKASMKLAAAPERAAAESPAKPPQTKSVPATPVPVPPPAAPREQQPDQWSEQEISEAKALCAATMKAVTIVGEIGAPLRNGACGTPAPLSLKRIGTSNVDLQPAATVNCRLASALDRWISDTLQPAAKAAFQSPVTRILVASSYTCRNRYGQADAPISEHAFANALDISGFVLADGRTISVRDAWGPTARDKPAAAPQSEAKPKSETRMKSGQAQAAPIPIPVSAPESIDKPANDPGRFLRELHKTSCATFGTVLGPEANEAHRDHLHLDLKERKHAHICE